MPEAPTVTWWTVRSALVTGSTAWPGAGNEDAANDPANPTIVTKVSAHRRRVVIGLHVA